MLQCMDTVVDIYAAGDEDTRMTEGRNQLEWIRTCELLDRWLPAAPAVVIDAGGGPGRQAAHLQGLGYAVTVFDIVPLHIEQATARGVPAYLGDARQLPLDDATVDAVLLLGPLYHLPYRDDRRQALAEAARLVRPGGVIVAAALSRWARVFVRAAGGDLADPTWLQHTLTTMRHGHVQDGDAWDQAVYLHDVDELRCELELVGLQQIQVVGVEGPAGAWARMDPSLTGHALELARVAETALAAASIHLLACGIRPLHQ